MKHIISNTQKALKLSALTALFITGSLLTRAAGNIPNEGHPREGHPGSATTAEVKYIGTNAGEPLFNVLYNNKNGARFSVKVMDGEGNQLFQGVFSDKKFDKKFQVTNAQDYKQLVFIIHNLEDNSEQSFEIDSNTRMIEDVEVKEVK